MLAGLALALGGTTLSTAGGTPPFITDDPGTPGNGHWEINLGLGTARSSDTTLSELPLIDLNYGIGDRLQLKYQVAYLALDEAGEPSRSGVGDSGVGIKWRFHDAGEGGLALSVFPQYEFNTLASSVDRGIVEQGSAFLLPVQLEQTLGPVKVNLQLGREFHSSGDSWYFGAALSHQLRETVAMGIELAGTASSRFDRSVLLMNLALAYDISESSSLLVSLGRELHNHEGSLSTLIGYIGWQLRL